MIQYEFKRHSTNGEHLQDSDIRILNELGEEGWELKNVVSCGGYVHFILQRFKTFLPDGLGDVQHGNDNSS